MVCSAYFNVDIEPRSSLQALDVEIKIRDVVRDDSAPRAIRQIVFEWPGRGSVSGVRSTAPQRVVRRASAEVTSGRGGLSVCPLWALYRGP